ncbi:hypothetical protein HMPREF9134_01801 [Porphyromonas catoniae F0037]|uniref:Uncharacterized protein n=1 Tax=Porphyromonas catoniae F0037 TaxID=1127696 RepID=L1N9E9_9PORP|nr:hypothetical protein HMPREF9134_01801 [Porphyromonas catoniae F0037]
MLCISNMSKTAPLLKDIYVPFRGYIPFVGNNITFPCPYPLG